LSCCPPSAAIFTCRYAQSTRIYAEAYSRDPNFYKLTRTLEAYRKVIDTNTTAILSSDSEFLKLLTHGKTK
jgi:membrane protease subunit HflC